MTRLRTLIGCDVVNWIVCGVGRGVPLSLRLYFYDDLGYDSPKDQSKHSITNDYEVQPVYFIRNAVYKDDFG